MSVDESRRAELTAVMRARHGNDIPGGGGVVPPPPPPHDPSMEPRVVALEGQAKETQDTLHRLGNTLTRIETLLQNVATKTDVVKVEGIGNTLDAKLNAMDARVGRVEANVATALTTAIGKAIGPVAFVGILASAIGVIAGGATLYAWLSHLPWFPH